MKHFKSYDVNIVVIFNIFTALPKFLMLLL